MGSPILIGAETKPRTTLTKLKCQISRNDYLSNKLKYQISRNNYPWNIRTQTTVN